MFNYPYPMTIDMTTPFIWQVTNGTLTAVQF